MYPCPPMTPRPPWFVTAAANSGPLATFIPTIGRISISTQPTLTKSDVERIPASRIGWRILNKSVMGWRLLTWFG